MLVDMVADLYLRLSAFTRRLAKSVSFAYVHSTEPELLDGSVLTSTSAPPSGSLEHLKSSLPTPFVGQRVALVRLKPESLCSHLAETCRGRRVAF